MAVSEAATEAAHHGANLGPVVILLLAAVIAVPIFRRLGLGAVLLMQWGGLSMAMGAFLTGVLLSESSFRHQLEADIEPFRGLLLGLFFLGVGMALDLNVIARNGALIAICVPAYMILKMAVIYGVARVLMAQGGEFAFVLYATALQFGILSGPENATLTGIVIVSMVLTPLMIMPHDRMTPDAVPSLDRVETARDLRARVLMVGCGRMGQIISQPLIAPRRPSATPPSSASRSGMATGRGWTSCMRRARPRPA